MIYADVVSAVGQTTASIGAGIEADLVQASTIAGMNGKFEVDLAVLYGYYDRLSTLFTHVTELVSEQADDATTRGSGAASRIAGVAAAERATQDARTGDTSLRSALQAIRAELADHLRKLHDTYTTYVAADENGSRRLTAAANPAAGHTAYGLAAAATSTSGKPSGW